MAHFAFLTLFNIVYVAILVTSTVLLYNILEIYGSDPNKLHTKDFILISAYFFPSAIFYIAASIGLAYIIFKTSPNDYNRIHADVIFLWCVNLTILRRPPDSYAKDNCINECCDKISSNLPMIIFNIICLFLTVFIIFLVFPLLPIGLLYNEDQSAVYLGVFSQYIIITINVLFHLFCLTEYEYYSLVIILLGLFYIFSGLIYHGVDSFEINTILWVIFEILSTLLMLTITFTVQYSDSIFYWINIAFFINYLFPNIPFSKLLLNKLYEDKFKYDSYFKFITVPPQYNAKCYYILHTLLHTNTPYSLDSTESTKLLSNVDSAAKDHVANSVQCFKMQYEFAVASTRDKRKMISKLHPRTNVQSIGNVLTYLYDISSFAGFFYPVIWFGYYWIYNVWLQTYDSNAKYVFVWIICIVYCLMSVYWIVFICNNMWDKIGQIWNYKNAILFVWSVKDLLDEGWGQRHLKDATELFYRQEIIECIMNAQCFQADVALVILSYLYYSVQSDEITSISEQSH